MVLVKKFSTAAGHTISLGLCPTKLPVTWDIHLDVPAIRFPLFYRCGVGYAKNSGAELVRFLIFDIFHTYSDVNFMMDFFMNIGLAVEGIQFLSND